MASKCEKLLDAGNGTHYTDTSWKGCMLMWFIYKATCHYAFLLLYFFIVKPLSLAMGSATAEHAESLQAAYGFWVRGNTSFFEETTMNRTDMNASSPTYMHWVPPAGTHATPPLRAIAALMRCTCESMTLFPARTARVGLVRAYRMARILH